jgi:hypothetical protein
MGLNFQAAGLLARLSGPQDRTVELQALRRHPKGRGRFFPWSSQGGSS